MQRALLLSMVAILVSGCQATETSIQAQAKQDGPGVRAKQVAQQANPARTQLQAVIEPSRPMRDNCPWGDSMDLTIVDGRREVLRHEYCSAYNQGRARVVTDAQGKHYVLLEHSEGHGTRAVTRHLTVNQLTDYLDERARLTIAEPIGIAADAVYDYDVTAPAGGGIIVSGLWRVNGELFERDHVPPWRRTVIEVDTASATRR